jgi:hypothetical protein
MSIYGNTRNAERIPKHHIGSFAAHARQRHQFLEAGRNLAPKAVAQSRRQSVARFCLRPEKPKRMQNLLQIFARRARHRLGIWVAPE